MGRPVEFEFDKAVLKVLAYIKRGTVKNQTIQRVKTVAHICKYLGISKDTWYRHKKMNKNKDISDALNKIKAAQEVWWIDIGLSGKYNSTAWIFCQKNIFGWKDKKDVKIELPKPVVLEGFDGTKEYLGFERDSDLQEDTDD